MTWAAALFVVAAFVLLAHFLRIPARAREVVERSRQAMKDLRDPELDERQRERVVQGHAMRLLVLFVVLTVGAAVALAVPFGVVALFDSAGIVSMDAVVALTVSWPFLLGTFVVGFGAWGLLRSRRA